MARYFPAIHVPHNAPKEIKAIAEAVTTLIGHRGQGQDRALTMRDIGKLSGLSGNSSASGGGSSGGGSAPVIVPPATALTGLVFYPTFHTVYILYDHPDTIYQWYAYTEVWRATVNDEFPDPAFSSAVLVATTINPFYTDMVAHNTTYRYWLRHVNRNGAPGPISSTGGDDVTTFQTPGDAIAEYSKPFYDTPIYQWLRSDVYETDLTIGQHTVEYDGEQVAYDDLAEIIRLKAEETLGSENAAAQSASQAADQATNAASSAGAASTSEGNASASAGSASTSESNAQTSASSASSSASEASASASSAETEAGKASSSASNAASSASESSGSAENASNSASAANISKLSAQASASDAGTSENNASNSASAALTYRNAAQASATSAEDSASAASSSALNANASKGDAESAAELANTSVVNAQAAEDNASNSASAAQASALTATSKATAASNSASAANTSAGSASTSATNAGNSASAANASKLTAQSYANDSSDSADDASDYAIASSNSASSASTSATNAGNSATAASGSQLSASASATNAEDSATNAEDSATNAEDSAAAAGNSAKDAGNSETNASNSAEAANASVGEAQASANDAENSASAANLSKLSASTSATNASNSAVDAGNSATNAGGSESNASGYASAANASAESASASSTSAGNFASAASGHSLTAENEAGKAAVSAQASADAGLDYSAQWGVKTAVGDLQGGIGFYNDGTKTYFVVDATDFVVTNGGTPTDDNLPFFISGGDTYLKKAMIDHAEIYNLIAANITAESIKASIDITSPVINGGSIFGSTINIGNGNFTVNNAGEVDAKGAVFRNSAGAVMFDSGGITSEGASTVINSTYVQSRVGSTYVKDITDATYIASIITDDAFALKAWVGTLEADRISGDVYDAIAKRYTGTITKSGTFTLFSGSVSTYHVARKLHFKSIQLVCHIESESDESAYVTAAVRFKVGGTTKHTTLTQKVGERDAFGNYPITIPDFLTDIPPSASSTSYKVEVVIGTPGGNHYFGSPSVTQLTPSSVSVFINGGSLS